MPNWHSAGTGKAGQRKTRLEGVSLDGYHLVKCGCWFHQMAWWAVVWAIGRSKAILSNSNYWAASQRCTEREVPQEISLVKKQMLLHLTYFNIIFTPELLVTSDFPGTRGYMSFQCDGHVIKERRYYCCKVNGLLYLGLFQPWWPLDHHSSSQHPSSWILRQCSSNLVDTTAMNPNCNCHQNNVSVAQDAVTTPINTISETNCLTCMENIDAVAYGVVWFWDQ